MSTKAEAILQEIRSLPPAELRELRRRVNLLADTTGKPGKMTRGKRTLATLLRGGKVTGNTKSWLRLTRGAA